MADVAKAAGVSITTVSHALSGARQVSEDVRRRVHAAMDELGYVPSRAARNLATGNSHVIGLLVPDIGNSFFAELAKGAERAAIDRGYNMILGNTDFDHARDILYLEAIRSRAIDGLLYAAGSQVTTTEISRSLGDVPLVLVDEEVDGVEAPLVISDNAHGSELVAEHLRDLGHSHALVIGAAPGLRSGESRQRGFVERWRASGGIVHIVEGGFTEAGGRLALESARNLIEGGVTAVFAVNDVMALAAIATLQEWGLSVPEHISVVGFDDIEVARHVTPGLTTVSQHAYSLGTTAAQLLIDQLEDGGKTVTARTTLGVEFVERRSTGPHRGEIP